DIIRESLNEIAAEVAIALRDAHLDFPVFITVPNTGGSLATMACPIDPSDEDWAHASAIVCRIIGQRLGDAPLSGRSLPLRGCEWNNCRYRCYGRGAERGM